MSSQASLPQRTAAHLRQAGTNLHQVPALLGFDGFIDTILHVVDTRQSATEFARLKTIAEYGQRIVNAAGKSTNIELVQQDIKHGGNGPIMGFALSAMGVPVTYCGMTGYPNASPVFQEFAQQARLLPICDPALTDAIEFDDGKLIVGKHATVAQVTYQNIKLRVGEEEWNNAWNSARFVGMVNWTMLPYLTELWKHILADFPHRDGAARKTIFFDLADPEKRTREDLTEALEIIGQFQRGHDVILGLNEKEALQVIRALGVDVMGTGGDLMKDIARGIRERLGIGVCVVHPTEFAAAADQDGTALAVGPYTPTPKISTGAGDHFNAGFCCGQMLGFDLEESLQLGVGTSGYYVRNAASPTQSQLADFLDSIGGDDEA